MHIKNTFIYIALFWGFISNAQLKICEEGDTTPNISELITKYEFCYGSPIEIEINNPDLSIKWYDQPLEGKLLSESNSYTTPNLEIGTYTFYAEISNEVCTLQKRIPVQAIVVASLTQSRKREVLEMCYGGELTIDPKVDAFEYNWSTEEDTETIIVYETGTYSVTYRKNEDDNCTLTKYFKIVNAKGPSINRVVSNGGQLKLIIEKEGDFLYSLDGKKFQESPTFNNVRAGNYNFLAKEAGDCGAIGAPFRYVKLF